jgi:hypothetical protein
VTRLCRYCARPIARGTHCRTCHEHPVRVVHPAPDLRTVRVVPWEPDEMTFGTGDAAAMRAIGGGS